MGCSSSKETLKSNFKFRASVVGDMGVGKTSIIYRYHDGSYSPSVRPTIPTDTFVKISNHPDDPKVQIELELNDTAGQERYRTITSSFYRYSQVIIIVYSVSEDETFNNVQYWIEQISIYARKDVSLFIVANKVDRKNQEYQNNPDEFELRGRQLATKYNAHFKVISAKDNLNIKELFQDVLREAYTFNQEF